jgi:hypothetical protein
MCRAIRHYLLKLPTSQQMQLQRINLFGHTFTLVMFVVLSPLANYTDRAIAAGQRNESLQPQLRFSRPGAATISSK